MWVITNYIGTDIKLFEFNTEKEAKKAFNNIKGNKVITEVIYQEPAVKKEAA